MIHQGKIVVCCQGLIGGREKRISGHWDLNPGLESGPKSALPLNIYFPDHSSIPQEKIIYFFFFAITSFLTLAAQQPTSFQNFWGWLFPFLASFSTIPFSCQLHAAHQLSQLFPSLASFTRATTRASKSNLTVQLQRATTSADRHATRLPPHQPPFTQERLASTSAPARDLQVGWGGNKARGGGNKARGRSTSTAQHQHILLWQL